MNIEIRKILVGPIRTCCYIVNKIGNNDAFIVDPGDDADVICRKLTEWKLNPVAILLTHGHIDHIGAVSELKNKFDIDVYAYEKEKDMLKYSDLNLSSALFGKGYSIAADKYLSDNQKINIAGIDILVIYTPGHTSGSCCFYLENEGVLLSGDTLFNSSHGRTDFPTGSQSAIIRSIKERLLVLDEDTVVYPGHEEDTTIGSERMMYDFY